MAKNDQRHPYTKKALQQKNWLTEAEKLCFTCTLPAEMCGKPRIMCPFKLATIGDDNARGRTAIKQTACGVTSENASDATHSVLLGYSGMSSGTMYFKGYV